MSTCSVCKVKKVQYKTAQLCKLCYNKQNKQNGYGDSIAYKVMRMYIDLVHRAEIKNIPLQLTKEEFYRFAKNNKCLKDLHNKYLKNGKQYKLIATVDRINNNLGYRIDNIQFLTLSENSTKGQKEKADMGIISGSRPCIFTKNGESLTFDSAAEAGRCFGKPRSSVARSCKIKRYLINGYSCKYL